MMRPRLDLGKLQYRDVVFSSSEDGQPLGTSSTSREPKESQWKVINIKIIEYVKEDDCPVKTLAKFMDCTATYIMVYLTIIYYSWQKWRNESKHTPSN